MWLKLQAYSHAAATGAGYVRYRGVWGTATFKLTVLGFCLPLKLSQPSPFLLTSRQPHCACNDTPHWPESVTWTTQRRHSVACRGRGLSERYVPMAHGIWGLYLLTSIDKCKKFMNYRLLFITVVSGVRRYKGDYDIYIFSTCRHLLLNPTAKLLFRHSHRCLRGFTNRDPG